MTSLEVPKKTGFGLAFDQPAIKRHQLTGCTFRDRVRAGVMTSPAGTTGQPVSR